MTLEPTNNKPKLAWYQHGWLAMPLVLIFVGVALGELTGLITFASFFVWVLLVIVLKEVLPKK